MAAPTLQAEGSDVCATSGTPGLTLPAHAADDILIMGSFFWGPSPGTVPDDIPTPGNPSGGAWAPVLGSQIGITDGTNVRGKGQLFWLRCASSTEGRSFTRGANWDTGTDTAWYVRAWTIRGCITSGNPWDEVDPAGPFRTANQNFDALTVAGAERLAIHFGLRSNAEAGFMGAAPGGWTAGASDNNTTGTDGSSRTYRQDNVSADTSAAAPTQSASSVGGYFYAGISFKPPASAVTFAAAVAGLGAVSAAVARERKLASTVAGLAQLVADIRRERKLASTVAGQAAVADAITVNGTVLLSSSVAGQAAIVAALKEDKRIAALVAGGATITVNQLRLERLLQALVAGNAQVVANLTVEGGVGAAVIVDVDQTVHIVSTMR